MKHILYIIYGSYNILGIILILWILLYLNTYINPNFIPSELRWQGGELRENMNYFMIAQLIILITQIGIFTYVGFLLNKRFLRRIIKKPELKLAKWTSITVLLTLLIISSYSLLNFYA